MRNIKELFTVLEKKTNNINIEKKLSSEEKFHDLKYTQSQASPAHYQYNPTYKIFLKMKDKLGDIKGKRILEYGCGAGWVTAELSSMGGHIDAFDISYQAINRTKAFLSRKKLDKNCTIQKMSAEKLKYPDESFDIIFGFAILHHLNLDMAMPELYRVMKPSSVAYFAEPLGENLLIKIYRKLTPQYRTDEERPIVLDEFLPYTKIFRKYTHEEFYLTALLPFALAYLPISRKTFDAALFPFMKIDDFLFKYFPALGEFAWYSIFELRK
jgi:ubiquinone/menaquinone biosynthesis C-methylase UbiE